MIAVGAVQSVVDRTVDLLDTLASEVVTPAEVAVVLREHGETGPDPTPEDVAALRGAATELRSVLAAPTLDLAAERVNALLARTAHPPRLSNHGGAFSWHVHVDSDDEEAPLAEWFLASAGLVLALLISDRQRLPGGVCAAAAASGCSSTPRTAAAAVTAPAAAPPGSGSPPTAHARDRVRVRRRSGPSPVGQTEAQVLRPDPAPDLSGRPQGVTATASTSTSWSS